MKAKMSGAGRISAVVTRVYGREYVGEYKDGLYHGQGTLIWANGDKYVGEFKEGLQHGQGTLTLADGKREDYGVIAGPWLQVFWSKIKRSVIRLWQRW